MSDHRNRELILDDPWSQSRLYQVIGKVDRFMVCDSKSGFPLYTGTRAFCDRYLKRRAMELGQMVVSAIT